jgi:hypothetical protein
VTAAQHEFFLYHFPNVLLQVKQNVVTLLLLLVLGRMTERGMVLNKGPSKQQAEV